MIKTISIWVTGIIAACVLVWGVAWVIGSNEEPKAAVKEDVVEEPTEVVAEEEPTEDSEEVVNEPMDDSVVTLASGEDAHDFVSANHDFYNETLGWGGIDDVDVDEQRTHAEQVVSALEGVETTDKNLAVDLESIVVMANEYLNHGSDSNLLNLHRLFHDLDIYFNGYDYDQTFGITNFTGKSDE